MYEKGQRIAIRRQTGEEDVVLVEDIAADDNGLKLKVRHPGTHHTFIVDPNEEGQDIVEHLED